MAEELNGTSLGDNPDAFSPLKCARRNLIDEMWTPPTEEAAASCSEEFATESLLLKKAKISTRSTSLPNLVKLLAAAREIAVLPVDEGDLVAKGMEFLMDYADGTKAQIVAALSKLVQTARLVKVEDLGIDRKRMTISDQTVFIKAVTARALDALVVDSLKESGLKKEWAAASIHASYENKTLVPAHATAFLKKHRE